MDNSSESPGSPQGLVERRLLRSQYHSMKNIISDGGDNANSNKLCTIIRELENLHQHVQRPREQVSDAETLLDIATSLVTSARSLRNGPTPSDFVDGLIRKFGIPGIDYNSANYLNKSSWNRIGMSVSQIFMRGHGYCTMNGPMDGAVKPRRSVVRRKRARPTQSSRPEDVGDMEDEPTKRTDTDRNMLTMFAILRKQNQAKLEYLVLNRQSFAETVENIFALSFLVKDGRAQITVDKNGLHFVSPRNAPAAAAITSGDVSFSHFVFRFGVKDWKAMREMVEPGAELMPHRVNSLNYATLASNASPVNTGSCNSVKYATPAYNISEVNSGSFNSVEYALGSDACQVNSRPNAPGSTSTPIKTLTRNRGLVNREDSVMNDSQNISANREVLFYRRKFRRLDDRNGSANREVLFYRRKYRRLDDSTT